MNQGLCLPQLLHLSFSASRAEYSVRTNSSNSQGSNARKPGGSGFKSTVLSGLSYNVCVLMQRIISLVQICQFGLTDKLCERNRPYRTHSVCSQLRMYVNFAV